MHVGHMVVKKSTKHNIRNMSLFRRVKDFTYNVVKEGPERVFQRTGQVVSAALLYQ